MAVALRRFWIRPPWPEAVAGASVAGVSTVVVAVVFAVVVVVLFAAGAPASSSPEPMEWCVDPAAVEA